MLVCGCRDMHVYYIRLGQYAVEDLTLIVVGRYCDFYA